MHFDAKKYWDDRLKGNYNLIGVGDISLTMNYNKWSYKVTRKILTRLFKKYAGIGADKKVLDIGSGTGFVIDIWNGLGKKITGVDISETAVVNLKKKYPGINFLEFDIGNDSLPLGNDSYNSCSAASVLYHIIEDEAFVIALKNVHRVLEKDGVFIFSDNFIHKGKLSISHQKCRSLEEYEYLITTNGFEIIDRVANYVLFNDPVDAKGKFYPIVWKINTRLSRKFRLYDKVIWPLLYPVERLLTRLIKESPAQEIIICKAIK